MANRKINEEQERFIALEILCGLRPESTARRFGICEQTARKIANHYSKELGDNLIEFYRECRNMLRNGTHLYLAFDGRKVPSSELVKSDDSAHCHVYHKLESEVFLPAARAIICPKQINQVMKEFEYLDESLTRMFKPSNGYEKLLCAVTAEWGIDRALRISGRPYKDYLLAQYNLGGKILPENAATDAKQDLLEKIKQGGLIMTARKKEIIDETICGLAEREQAVLNMRFGLQNYKEGITLEEASKKLGVSRERVRGIEAKALRKLRHPSRFKILDLANSLCSDEEIENYLARRAWKNELYAEIEGEVMAKVANDPDVRRKIITHYTEDPKILSRAVNEQLELSIRAANCLNNADIRTMSDLVSKYECELLRYRNFGRKSLLEIKEKLHALGLSLRK